MPNPWLNEQIQMHHYHVMHQYDSTAVLWTWERLQERTGWLWHRSDDYAVRAANNIIAEEIAAKVNLN